MKLQMATRLGLYAVLELADNPERQLSRQEIADKYDISSNHLSKVLRDLGKAGLVEAVRGVGGGYRFTGNPKRTTLLDVIRIFEPFPFEGPRQTEPGRNTDTGTALDMVLDETNDTIEATMDSITISTMLMLKKRLPGYNSNSSASRSVPSGS